MNDCLESSADSDNHSGYFRFLIPTSILQGTLSAVLPHYQSASYAFYPSFAFQAIYVYDSRHHRNIFAVTSLRTAFIVSREIIFAPIAA